MEKIGVVGRTGKVLFICVSRRWKIYYNNVAVENPRGHGRLYYC